MGDGAADDNGGCFDGRGGGAASWSVKKRWWLNCGGAVHWLGSGGVRARFRLGVETQGLRWWREDGVARIWSVFGRCCWSANKEEEDRSVVARNKLRGGDLQWRWHDGTTKLWQVCGGGLKVARWLRRTAGTEARKRGEDGRDLMEEDGGAAVRTKMVRRGCATAAGTVMTDVSAAAMRWCERGGVAVLMVVDGDGAAGALQVKVARRRKMMVEEARGCCCFRRGDGGGGCHGGWKGN